MTSDTPSNPPPSKDGERGVAADRPAEPQDGEG